MAQDNPLPPIAEEFPEPMLVLHTSYPTDDLDEENLVFREGFECLPAEIKQLLITSLANEPEVALWKRFINEAINLAALRAQAVPQTVTGLIECLLEWHSNVNSILPLQDKEEIALSYLLRLLRQEGLKTVQCQLKVLSEQLTLLME